MQSWDDIKKQMKADILANEPVARVNDDGAIELEVSDEFYRILDDFCKAGKTRARRIEAVLYCALAASVVLMFAFNAVFPQWCVLDSVHLWYIPAIIVGVGVATSADRSRKESKYYRDHLEEAFLKVARREYEAGRYRSVSDDGVS